MRLPVSPLERYPRGRGTSRQHSSSNYSRADLILGTPIDPHRGAVCARMSSGVAMTCPAMIVSRGEIKLAIDLEKAVRQLGGQHVD
jgi:hypothetical protein